MTTFYRRIYNMHIVRRYLIRGVIDPYHTLSVQQQVEKNNMVDNYMTCKKMEKKT